MKAKSNAPISNILLWCQNQWGWPSPIWAVRWCRDTGEVFITVDDPRQELLFQLRWGEYLEP